MLQSIQGNYTVTSLQFTFYFAAIKFLLAAIIIVYLIASLPFIMRKNNVVMETESLELSKGKTGI
jgi:hypothetical protein